MKFHDTLNEKLWIRTKEKHIGGKISYIIKSEVAEKLQEIADAFIEYMEIDPKAVKDIIITGSSASFNYTKHSDLDLHLKVDYDMIHEDCPIVEGFLWALKSTFNKDHDISIYGIPVEVYAEPIEEDAVSNGIYSIKQHKWIKEPEPIEPTDNDIAVNAKYNEIKEASEKIKDSEVAEQLLDKIYMMRKAGLTQVGEFSTENLAFKKLRDDGIINNLKQMKKQKIDKQLSLESYNENDNNAKEYEKEYKQVMKKIDRLSNKMEELRDSLDYVDDDKQYNRIVSKIEGLGEQYDYWNERATELERVLFYYNAKQTNNENSDRIKYSMLGSKKKRIKEINESSIIDRFKEMANKIAHDFKAEGYPKTNKYLLDFVDEAVKQFNDENQGYVLRPSTDNGQAVITLCDMNTEEDDDAFYQARISAYGNKKVTFTDLQNSNYAHESAEESQDDKKYYAIVDSTYCIPGHYYNQDIKASTPEGDVTDMEPTEVYGPYTWSDMLDKLDKMELLHDDVPEEPIIEVLNTEDGFDILMQYEIEEEREVDDEEYNYGIYYFTHEVRIGTKEEKNLLKEGKEMKEIVIIGNYNSLKTKLLNELDYIDSYEIYMSNDRHKDGLLVRVSVDNFEAFDKYLQENDLKYVLLENINEDINSLMNKIDNADSEIQDLIKSLNTTIDEALNE